MAEPENHTPMGTDFESRAHRARAFYQSMLPDVIAGLRGQTDAEESAIRKLTEAGYDYECSRRAILGMRHTTRAG